MSGKILIIDDDRFLCQILEDFAKEFGFEADAVTRVPEAKRLVAQGDYDVAIVDLHLPVITGFDFLEWVKTEAPSVVSIVLSGTSSIEEAVKAVRENAFDFVIKPVQDYEAFFQRVQRAVDFKRLRENRDLLVDELKDANAELANRLEQLTLAHRALQSHARAVAVDLDRARRIQESLLPRRLPFSERIAMSALFRPASKVGGDLFDVFAVGDEAMAIYVADVCGHGVSAAMLTVFLKDAVHAIDRERGAAFLRDPEAFLWEMNRRLTEELMDGDVFISMTYLVVDVTTYGVSFASAGHPPLLVRRGDGTVETHHGLSPALGIDRKARFEARQIRLDPGDRLLLYSDGIRDVSDEAGRLFGERGLVEALSGLDERGDALAPALGAILDAFAIEGDWPDDVTVLALGAEAQVRPFRNGRDEPRPVEDEPVHEGATELRHGDRGGRRFVLLAGAGTWKEAEPFRRLCEEGLREELQGLVLDLEGCPHLDSTFLGILHETATAWDERGAGLFEIQNPRRSVLHEMGELGLRDVLHHVRIQPLPLPEELEARVGASLNPQVMQRLLLRAHEQLVEADSENADRFDQVLRALGAEGREPA